MTPHDLDILRAAVATNLVRVQENPTGEVLKNWRASVRELEEAEAEFTGDGGGQDRIKGIPGVVRYLDDRGYKLSTSTAYNHRETNRMPGPDKDGYFSADDLNRYASEYLKRKDGSSDADDENASQSDKQRSSAEKEKQQAENWRIRNEILKGTYVERSFMEREFGSRSAFLRTDLNTFWEIHALTIIEMVGGDTAKVPALIEKGQDWVRDWTDRYARPVKYPNPKAPAGEPGE
jgi:hypothetical protein